MHKCLGAPGARGLAMDLALPFDPIKVKGEGLAFVGPDSLDLLRPSISLGLTDRGKVCTLCMKWSLQLETGVHAMETISAKQLKQKTGEVMKRVRAGERMTVTHRGKAVAVITPSTQEKDLGSGASREFEESWGAIEAALGVTEPRFEGWREATEWVRKRV